MNSFFYVFLRFQFLLIFISVNNIILSQKNNLKKTDSNLIFIEAGKFKIGSKNGEKDEKPAHKVKLSDFYISKYEITNAEYVIFLNSEGNKLENNTLWINTKGKWNNITCRITKKDNKFIVEKGFGNYPVNFVSWYGANAYCKWKGGRLPTEAEWEYAAYGGTPVKTCGRMSKKHANNINIDSLAWYKSNSKRNLYPVGLKIPNKLGIYDMQGSLWEWCADWYNEDYYKKKEKKNPKCTKKADFKVIKGGSWANDKKMLRISNRNGRNPNSNKVNIGFRIVM